MTPASAVPSAPAAAIPAQPADAAGSRGGDGGDRMVEIFGGLAIVIAGGILLLARRFSGRT